MKHYVQGTFCQATLDLIIAVDHRTRRICFQAKTRFQDAISSIPDPTPISGVLQRALYIIIVLVDWTLTMYRQFLPPILVLVLSSQYKRLY